jgi:hypothetical protein
MNALSLKELLREWEDQDTAAFQVGVTLGILPPDDPGHNTFRRFKGLLWSNNPVGNFLYHSLDELVRLGFIEHDDNEMKYRWREGSAPLV